MFFRQFVDDDLGCASYLIGDEGSGEAVVVDPAYAIEQYADEAARHGLRIAAVLETHTHADHVSGHGRFALEHGIPVAIHPDAEPEYPFEPVHEGACFEAGAVVIHAMHTPGHRPEHCCFTVTDRSRAEEPWLVLTGDSLLVGDTARPDLAIAARDGARSLFHSLQRLLELPDGVELYPGHVAGSLCGAAVSAKPSSTIGFERRFNRTASILDASHFITEAAALGAPRPPNMERIVELNRGPFVGRRAPLGPVQRSGDATVLDVRPAEVFAAGHVPGAINVPIDAPSYATKAAFVLTPDEPVVLHGGSRDELERAARGLRAVGFLDVAGYLENPEAPARLAPIGLDELERLLAQDAIQVLDVREKSERDGGYIPGSRNIPYRLLRECGDGLDKDRPVATICESGARAGVAASILAAEGIEARPVLHGGVLSWQARGNQTVQFRRCGN